MKLPNKIVPLATLLLSNTLFANPIQFDFVTRMLNAVNFAEKNQQKVWPGFHPAKTASLIQFKDTTLNQDTNVAYAFNFKPGNQPWQKLTNNGNDIYYLSNASGLDIPDDIVLIPVVEIEGQLTYIDRESTDALIPRESIENQFTINRAAYYLTNESSIPVSKAAYLNIPYDNYNNPTLLKLIYLEDAALTASQQTDASLAEEALQDAIAIHQYRDQLMSQQAREFENANEIFSGTPSFISLSSQQLSRDDYRKMSQRSGCFPLNSLWGPLGYAACDQAQFWNFASSVYGAALDQKLSNQAWKEGVTKKFKSISQVAIDYYHFSNEQAKQMAEQAMQKPAYNYSRIEKIIDFEMQPYLENMKTSLNTFNQTPGTEFHIPFAYGYVVFFLNVFTPVFSDMYLINNDTQLLTDINLPTTATKPKNIPLFSHQPYLLIQVAFNGYDIDFNNIDRSYASFKLTNDAKLTIDGVVTSVTEFVNNKKIQSYKNLLIEDEHVYFELTVPGKLDASSGVLKLSFDEAANNQLMKQLSINPSAKLKDLIFNQVNIQKKY